MGPARAIGILAGLLLAVAGLGCLGSRAVLARASPVAPEEQYVDAPAPVARAGRDVGPGRPVGTREVDRLWVADTATREGIPAPALRAYENAQLAEPTGCRVGWTTLACSGWVESHHGTTGGRTLRGDARSSTPILGPALDGCGELAAIPATPETTAWHGDRSTPSKRAATGYARRTG